MRELEGVGGIDLSQNRAMSAASSAHEHAPQKAPRSVKDRATCEKKFFGEFHTREEERRGLRQSDCRRAASVATTCHLRSCCALLCGSANSFRHGCNGRSRGALASIAAVLRQRRTATLSSRSSWVTALLRVWHRRWVQRSGNHLQQAIALPESHATRRMVTMSLYGG